MTDPRPSLADVVEAAAAVASSLPQDAAARLRGSILASLACCGAVGPGDPDASSPWGTGRVTGGMAAAMASALVTGTRAAGADLDPLDKGPAHLALPATVAACELALHAGHDGGAVDAAIGVGIELASRLRAAVVVRPGVGFHSVGVYGTVAAAATCAALLDLDPPRQANAVGIGLTRSAGLGTNPASKQIGLTHFGWAAAHGIEAAILAAKGIEASWDYARALETLSGSPPTTRSCARSETEAFGPASTFFKYFPCNVYLNLLVLGMQEAPTEDSELIEVILPPVRHLDNAEPADLRAARNSAQGVMGWLAKSAGRTPRYADFLGAAPPGTGNGAPAAVRFDDARATRLGETQVDLTFEAPGGTRTTIRVGGDRLTIPPGAEWWEALLGDRAAGWLKAHPQNGTLDTYVKIRDSFEQSSSTQSQDDE